MFQTISPVFFSELVSREKGCRLCTDFLNKASKWRKQKIHNFLSKKKKKTRGCHHFLFFNLLFGNRDIQFSAAFYRQNIWARGGFGVKWTGGRSLPFWEAQKQRGSDCSPSLILTECTSTKCLVRYNQRLAQALLPSFAHPLKQITKLVPRALQT